MEMGNHVEADLAAADQAAQRAEHGPAPDHEDCLEDLLQALGGQREDQDDAHECDEGREKAVHGSAPSVQEARVS